MDTAIQSYSWSYDTAKYQILPSFLLTPAVRIFCSPRLRTLTKPLRTYNIINKQHNTMTSKRLSKVSQISSSISTAKPSVLW